MGRPIFYDTETGQYHTLEQGKPRPLTDEEFLTVTMPENRQGVSSLERATAMSLTNDSVAAERYLEGQGYFVKRYGQGWNFAVQKRTEGQTAPDPNKWSVVDPRGALDAVKDIFLDNAGFLGAGVLSDAGRFIGAVGGAVTGAGVGGGIPGGVIGAALGSVAGAGAGGAGGEFLRQKLGQAAGVPQEIDDDQIIAAGLIGAAVPVAGPAFGRVALKGGRLAKQAAGRVVSGAGDVLTQLGAKFAGLEQGKSLISGAEALLTRAASTAHFPEIVAQLKIMRQRVGATITRKTAESRELDDLINKSSEKFDLRPLLKAMRSPPSTATTADKAAIRKNYLEVVSVLRSALGTPAPRVVTSAGQTLARGAEKTIDPGTGILMGGQRASIPSGVVRATRAKTVEGLVGDPMLGQMPHDPLWDEVRHVPASVVNTVRRLVGKQGQFNQTSAVQGATKDSTNKAQVAAGRLGGMLGQRLGTRVDELFNTVSEQTQAAKDLGGRIGRFTETGRSVGLKTGSEKALRATFQQGASDFLDTVRRFDKWHKTDFEAPLKLAIIGERFSGPGGTPARTLRPTVAGGVFGSGAIQSATGLSPKGGITGALARATGAFGIGTEAGVVGATRFLKGIPVTPLGQAGRRIRIGAAATERAIGRGIDLAGDVLASAPSRAAQVAAMQQAIREQMATQPLIEGSDLLTAEP